LKFSHVLILPLLIILLATNACDNNNSGGGTDSEGLPTNPYRRFICSRGLMMQILVSLKKTISRGFTT